MRPLVHAAAIAGLLIILLAIWRYISRRSLVIGRVLLAGLVLRVTLGFSLFAISYWDLPVLQHLHSSDGFWELAPDARSHYRHSREALEHGLASAWDHSAPLYVASYALWMSLVGVNPASGMLLNIVAFGLFSAVAVRFFRPTGRLDDDLPCALVIASLGLLPSVVIHGTQSLKDDLVLVSASFALLAAAVAYSSAPAWSAVRTSILAAAVSGGALLFLTGLRSYFALMVFVCLVLGAMVRTWTGRSAFLPTAVACSLFVLGSWTGYRAGEDPYWNPMRAAEVSVPNAPTRSDPPSAGGSPAAGERPDVFDAALLRLRASRLGFISAGGATNVVPVGEMQAEAERNWTDDWPALLTGVALLFVPIDLLVGLGLVEFGGGRGLLGISDLDTVLLDAIIVGILVIAWRRRQTVSSNLAIAAVTGGLFVLTATLLAYAVTNYGTLFRLRAMMLVPLWILALVLRPSERLAAVCARPDAALEAPSTASPDRVLARVPSSHS